MLKVNSHSLTHRKEKFINTNLYTRFVCENKPRSYEENWKTKIYGKTCAPFLFGELKSVMQNWTIFLRNTCRNILFY